jgi:hypothetical protein
MSENVEWVLFGIVAAIAVVFVMLVNRLRQAHPSAWSAMGKPVAQIWRGNYKGRWGLLKFLFTEAHRELNDNNITSLVWMMRALIAAGLVIAATQFLGGQRAETF